MAIEIDNIQLTHPLSSAVSGVVDTTTIQSKGPEQAPEVATMYPGPNAEGAGTPSPEQAEGSEASGHCLPDDSNTALPLLIQLRLLVEEMLVTGEAQLRRSTTGTTWLHAGELPGIAAVDAPLFDRSSQAWMAALAWARFQEMPKGGELNSLAFALLGRAPTIVDTEPGKDELLAELRQDPVAGAIVALLDNPSTKSDRWDGTMGSLHEQLINKSPLQYTSTRAFPGSASILSRHLRLPKTIALLAAFGVTLEIRRSNGSKVCLSSTPDGNTDRPQCVLSVDDSVLCEESKNTDGKDGEDGSILGCGQLGALVSASGVRKPIKQ